MSSNAIPCLRAQIEALFACEEAIRIENEQRRLAQALAKQKMRSGTTRIAKLRQQEAHSRYLAVIKDTGGQTSQQVADRLKVTQSAARAQLKGMHKLGLVRDVGTPTQHIWEAV